MPEKGSQGVIEISSKTLNQKYIGELAGLFGEPSEATIPLFRGEERVVFQWETEDNEARTDYQLGLKRTLSWFSASPFYVTWMVTREQELVGTVQVFNVTSIDIDEGQRFAVFNGVNENGKKIGQKLSSPRDTVFA